MADSFASILRQARGAARDPVRRAPISQELFAELLEQSPFQVRVTAAAISNWERGRAQPRMNDRACLCAIVGVLLRYGGLADLSHANALLIAGGYAPLTAEEVRHCLESQPTGLNNPEQRHASATLIAIRHQSMEQIPARAIQAALPQELRNCVYREFVVDQCDLFQSGRLSDPGEAVRRQRDLEMRVAALLAEHPEAHIAYYGIAHIPLLFLAGYTLSNRRAVLQFENDRHTRTWNLLQRGGESPQLHISGLPNEVVWEAGEVVVRISVSYPVTPAAVADVVPAPLASVELGLEQPQPDCVTSVNQLRIYAQAFRQTMDLIHGRLPHASGIHIFYAGPPSLAFLCGQLVSKTIHPRLVVYNFVGKDRPQYAWGLDLTRAIDAPDFLVRPRTPEGASASAPATAPYADLPMSAA